MRAPRTMQCRDGYVVIGTYQPGIGERTLDLMLRWAGEEGVAAPDLTQRSWLAYMSELTSGALTVDDFNRGYDAIGAFVATKTKRELLDGALERKLLLAPIHDVTDVRADPQLASRDYWTDVGGDSHPGPFARLSATPIRMACACAAPRRGSGAVGRRPRAGRARSHRARRPTQRCSMA